MLAVSSATRIWQPNHPTQAEDPDLPAFYFDPVINPISAFRSTRQTGWEEEEEDDEGSWEVREKERSPSGNFCSSDVCGMVWSAWCVSD